MGPAYPILVQQFLCSGAVRQRGSFAQAPAGFLTGTYVVTCGNVPRTYAVVEWDAAPDLGSENQ